MMGWDVDFVSATAILRMRQVSDDISPWHFLSQENKYIPGSYCEERVKKWGLNYSPGVGLLLTMMLEVVVGVAVLREGPVIITDLATSFGR